MWGRTLSEVRVADDPVYGAARESLEEAITQGEGLVARGGVAAFTVARVDLDGDRVVSRDALVVYDSTAP